MGTDLLKTIGSALHPLAADFRDKKHQMLEGIDNGYFDFENEYENYKYQLKGRKFSILSSKGEEFPYTEAFISGDFTVFAFDEDTNDWYEVFEEGI